MPRYDDIDDGIPIRSRRGANYTPLWVATGGAGLVLMVAVALVIAGWAKVGKAVGERGASDIQKTVLGREVRVGDLGVTVTRVAHESVGSRTMFGRIMDHGWHYTARIAVRNYNPNRLHSAKAQTGLAFLADDVGNQYDSKRLISDVGGEVEWGSHIPPGQRVECRSDGGCEDAIAMTAPVEGARKLKLFLDAGCYGGSGWIEVGGLEWPLRRGLTQPE